MRSLTITFGLVLACVLRAAGGSTVGPSADSTAIAKKDGPATVQPVSGSGVHYLTTAIVHSSEPTGTGMVQHSTETVDLTGDLTGRILYQPTSVFDFVAGTLVNTGRQVFSGTVLGSAPVMLYDDEFRFEVNLNTGATIGKVHLAGNIAGPRISCELTVIATGRTPDGNIAASYTGYCTFKKK
jgi:hypothetical protein